MNSNPSPIREVTEESVRDEQLNDKEKSESEKYQLNEQSSKAPNLQSSGDMLTYRNNTENEERKSNQVYSTGAS